MEDPILYRNLAIFWLLILYVDWFRSSRRLKYLYLTFIFLCLFLSLVQNPY